MRLGDGGVTKGGMTNRPGSATNLKASESTLLSCSVPDTRPRYRTKGSSGTKLRVEQIPVCRSIVTDRTHIESIGGALRTKTLARSRRRRYMPPVCGKPCGLGSARAEKRAMTRHKTYYSIFFFFFFFAFRVYCPLLLATRHHSATTTNYYQ